MFFLFQKDWGERDLHEHVNVGQLLERDGETIEPFLVDNARLRRRSSKRGGGRLGLGEEEGDGDKVVRPRKKPTEIVNSYKRPLPQTAQPSQHTPTHTKAHIDK